MKKESVFRHLYQMNHTNEDIASPRWECLDISLFQSEADVLLSLIWLYFSYVQTFSHETDISQIQSLF
jgi:hypothetical protein